MTDLEFVLVIVSIFSIVGWALVFHLYFKLMEIDKENDSLKDKISEFPSRDASGRFTKRK